MIKLIMHLVLLLFLLSCKNSSEKNKKLNMAPHNVTDNVKSKYLIFEEGDIDTAFLLSRKETPYKGRVLSKAQWSDLNGHNRFIVSIQDTNYADGMGRYELFAYQYSKEEEEEEEEWVVYWQMNDFVKGLGCDLNIEVLQTEIIDIDNNGAAESILIYTLDSRCDASCLPTKLLLYSDGKKLAIRGLSSHYLMPPLPLDLTINNEHLKSRDSANYKIIDTSEFNGNQLFIEYASNLWDSFIDAENKQHKQKTDYAN